MKPFPEIVTNSHNYFAAFDSAFFHTFFFFLSSKSPEQRWEIVRAENNASKERLKKFGLLSWRRGGNVALISEFRGGLWKEEGIAFLPGR